MQPVEIESEAVAQMTKLIKHERGCDLIESGRGRSPGPLAPCSCNATSETVTVVFYSLPDD
jgi:hypothetical protein